MPSGLKKTKGWIRFAKILIAKSLDKEIRKELKRISQRVGEVGVSRVHEVIQGGDFEPNKSLSVVIKGSSKPLVGRTSQLFQAISSRVLSWDKVFVGVLRMDKHYNIAKAVHDGTELPVTDKMRGLFFTLWKVSKGDMSPTELTSDRAQELWDQYKQWTPLKDSTTVIVVPGRPYMEKAFDDDTFADGIVSLWRRAVDAAIRNRARA